MRHLALAAAFAITLMSGPGTAIATSSRSTSCDIKGVYNGVDTPVGTIALTVMGQAEEVSKVLVPTELKSGSYDVSVTRKGQDLYRVDGTSTYIGTRYCYEYAYSQKAVLRYQSLGIAGSGTLEFE